MNAELIAVGTEILAGDVLDTNTAWLARELHALGIHIYHRHVVGDNMGRITELLSATSKRADLVIVTGGLGSTYDDITKQALAQAAQLPLVESKEAIEAYNTYFAKVGRRPSENIIRQAWVPEGSTIYPNSAGLAPGIGLSLNRAWVVLLPGPPHEMQATFRESVVRDFFKIRKGALFTDNIHIYGLGEAEIDKQLRDYMPHLTNPTVAPYVADGEVILRVRTYAGSEREAVLLSTPVIDHIRQTFPKHVYGVNTESLEATLAPILMARQLTVCTAESCTGGLIMKKLTDPPGASAYFRGGICAYNNEVKSGVLQVCEDTLDTFGAVSEETVREMCIGGARLFHTDISVATTGVAGPSGGSTEKPVGLVWIGLYYKGEVFTERFIASPLVSSSRERVREAASKRALFMLHQFLCRHI